MEQESIPPNAESGDPLELWTKTITETVNQVLVSEGCAPQPALSERIARSVVYKILTSK